jgi:hypothetical protein
MTGAPPGHPATPCCNRLADHSRGEARPGGGRPWGHAMGNAATKASARANVRSTEAMAHCLAVASRACLHRLYHVDRLIPSASHGRCAGRRGAYPMRPPPAFRAKAIALAAFGCRHHAPLGQVAGECLRHCGGRATRRLPPTQLGIHCPCLGHPQIFKGSLRKLRVNLKLAA